MKTYAHAVLAVFLVVLGVKMYNLKVDRSIKSHISQSRESILESDTATVDLTKLKMVEYENVERRLAQMSETGEEDFAIKMGQLDQLAIELEQAIMETGDNFEMIAHLKSKIANIKEANSLGLSNIEEWDMELVYFLVIEERMTLEEINALNNPTDLNMNEKEWDVIVSQSHSSKFKKKIFEYKDIELDALEKHLQGLSTGDDQEELIEEIWGDAPDGEEL